MPHFGGNPRYDQDPGCSCSELRDVKEKFERLSVAVTSAFQKRYGHNHVTDKMLLSMARELGVAERDVAGELKAQEFLQPDPSHADLVLGRTQKKPL